MRKNIIILFLCLLFCGCKKGRLFIEIPNNLIFNEGIISELFHYYSNRYETNDEKILVEITEEDLLKIENCIETIISLNDLNLFNYEYSVNKNKPFFYNSVFLKPSRIFWCKFFFLCLIYYTIKRLFYQLFFLSFQF